MVHLTTDEGSVYVYRLDRGKFRNPQKLESPDKKVRRRIRISVSQSSNGRVVVGQPYNYSAGPSNPGSAYIYSYGY